MDHNFKHDPDAEGFCKLCGGVRQEHEPLDQEVAATEGSGEPKPKRIVIRHADGRFQILGMGPGDGSQPKEFVPVADLPECVATRVPMNLVAARQKYWEYRPLMLPDKRKPYDPRQQ